MFSLLTVNHETHILQEADYEDTFFFFTDFPYLLLFFI